MFYLDTSAAVKLVVAERGSTALRRWLLARTDRVFSSDLLRTELLRVTRRSAPDRMVVAKTVLDSVTLLTLSTEICDRAALLGPATLRSLDSLHLAAALELGDDLEGVVTYDEQMTNVAHSLGVRTVAPI